MHLVPKNIFSITNKPQLMKPVKENVLCHKIILTKFGKCLRLVSWDFSRWLRIFYVTSRAFLFTLVFWIHIFLRLIIHYFPISYFVSMPCFLVPWSVWGPNGMHVFMIYGHHCEHYCFHAVKCWCSLGPWNTAVYPLYFNKIN